MITTDNAEWAARMRMMSLHGLSRDAWNRYSSQGSWYYEILSPGFKYNLTDIAAALGLAQLKKCERFWKGREQYAVRYQEGFKDLPEIVCPEVAAHVQHAWHLYVINWSWIACGLTVMNSFVNFSRLVSGVVCISSPSSASLPPRYGRLPT